MNHAMYEHPATQANLQTLRARGTTVLDPDTGALGSPGEYGIGRLPEPAALLAAVESALAGGGARGTTGDREPVPGHVNGDRRWSGVHVLVTAGGTREPIDSVRFVGNRSSGRMGLALAEGAKRRGATVTVVAANVSIPRPPGIEYLDVQTAAELADACAARFEACDVLLMAAAVADYRPAEAYAGKLKKDATGEELTLRLSRTEDVLSALAARRRPGQLIVGFAAEHGDEALANGREKLARKGLDAIVVNDVGGAGVGFESPDNEVWVVTADEELHVPKASKGLVAAAILDAVLSRRSSSEIKVRR
jgi:phosphopantothenoylcysteine decarboxylase/phosphopantothenate--cysteine ligase